MVSHSSVLIRTYNVRVGEIRWSMSSPSGDLAAIMARGGRGPRIRTADEAGGWEAAAAARCSGRPAGRTGSTDPGWCCDSGAARPCGRAARLLRRADRDRLCSVLGHEANRACPATNRHGGGSTDDAAALRPSLAAATRHALAHSGVAVAGTRLHAAGHRPLPLHADVAPVDN